MILYTHIIRNRLSENLQAVFKFYEKKNCIWPEYYYYYYYYLIEL
jgi:hypothetical protein